jgi:hypothetical protein
MWHHVTKGMLVTVNPSVEYVYPGVYNPEDTRDIPAVPGVYTVLEEHEHVPKRKGCTWATMLMPTGGLCHAPSEWFIPHECNEPGDVIE